MRASPWVPPVKTAQLASQQDSHLVLANLFSGSFELGVFGEAVGFHCMWLRAKSSLISLPDDVSRYRVSVRRTTTHESGCRVDQIASPGNDIHLRKISRK